MDDNTVSPGLPTNDSPDIAKKLEEVALKRMVVLKGKKKAGEDFEREGWVAGVLDSRNNSKVVLFLDNLRHKPRKFKLDLITSVTEV